MISAFNLPTPAPGETATAAAGLNTWGTLAAGGYGDGTDDTTDPKAFVNIVLFDKDHNFLDVAYAQLKGTDLYYLSASYTVKEAGYAYLYVSNEQPVQTDVYFDDVTMTYTPSNILQSSEYYPFGLQTQNSWTRDSTVGNNFLYDAGNELNTTTGVYETMFRGYDPALGRFMQVDPLAYRSHNLTPYHYAGNNPIGYNDPTGLKVALNIYDIINFLWNNTEYGGSWSNDGGNGGGGTFDPYDSQDEADSYNKAAYQQYQAGGGGSIVKQTTEAYAEYGTTDGAHVKRKYNPGGTTYVYVPGDSEGGSSNDDLSMSQVSQSMEDQFAEFVKFFFGKQLSQINATKNVTWSIYDPNVDLRGDYGLTGRRRDGSVHIGIGIKAMQDHKLLYITVEHELIHATDYILGVYDYFEQMVQHDLDWLGRDDLMGLLKEGNAYPTTVQTEIGFGTNYGFQQKLFGINAELKDVGLSYLLGR